MKISQYIEYFVKSKCVHVLLVQSGGSQPELRKMTEGVKNGQRRKNVEQFGSFTTIGFENMIYSTLVRMKHFCDK